MIGRSPQCNSRWGRQPFTILGNSLQQQTIVRFLLRLVGSQGLGAGRLGRALADTRIHGTTKRQVAAMFAEERAALQPLPLEPFRYYRFGVRTVHLDGCVEVEAAYYSTPPGWIGQRVHVQWTDGLVRCSCEDRAAPARARPRAGSSP